MIGFMYASDYKVPKDFSAILMHTTIYALSIRFEMPALQTLAKTRFEEELSSFGRKLEQINLVELTPEIYESTVESDQGLREPLVRCVGDSTVFRSSWALRILETLTKPMQSSHSISCAIKPNMALYHPLRQVDAESVLQPRAKWLQKEIESAMMSSCSTI